MGRSYRDSATYADLSRVWDGSPGYSPDVPVRKGWDSNAPAANTYVRLMAGRHRDAGDELALTFYSTPLFSLFPAGWGRLHVSHGTATTASRLRRFLPSGCGLASIKGDWHLCTGGREIRIPSAGIWLPHPIISHGRISDHLAALMAGDAPLEVLADAVDDAHDMPALTESMRTVGAALVA